MKNILYITYILIAYIMYMVLIPITLLQALIFIIYKFFFNESLFGIYYPISLYVALKIMKHYNVKYG